MVSHATLALLVAPLLIFTGTARSAKSDTYAYMPRRDGTLAGYSVDDRTGKLDALPGVTSIGADRPPVLVLSADRRFLYAFWGFGWDPNDNEFTPIGDDIPRPARKTGTRIAVLRVGPAGTLTSVQTLSLPSPIAELEPHPGGRFVYGLKVAEGAFLLAVGKDGRLSLRGSQDIISGVGGANIVGERDDWDLTFSPNGAYLYDYLGDGFVDHFENVLQR
ncbi:MAG: hypothetical protein H8F28_03935, partial [Fibrella sp.]|nr:hypothetical protein [Armatimonadota bacterium]